MFKLTYRPKNDRDHSKTEYFNDIKDLGQALINIVDNEKEEKSAMEWCSRASFGDKVVRQQFGYKIECVRDNDSDMKRGPITNAENSLRTLLIAIKEGYDLSVDIKKINTGSYRYIATVNYSKAYGLIYFVTKHKTNGQLLGQIRIDNINYYGMEYHSIETFKIIPDSIKKAIINFDKELQYRISQGV